jgi:hypothetical protein
MDPRQHFDKVLILLAVFGVLAGCSQARDADIVDDILWDNGNLHCIVEHQTYTPLPNRGFGYSEESDALAGKDWSLIVWPFPPRQSAAITRKAKFTQISGACYLDGFLSIAGSDLLIHESGTLDVLERPLKLFDPTIRRDISSLPAGSSGQSQIMNRSRTACLGLQDGRAVVCDVLSTHAGEIKTTPVPRWTPVMNRKFAIGGHVILTENRRYLVILYSAKPSADPTKSNFKVEVLPMEGTGQTVTMPLTSVLDELNDAEYVDGKIMIVSSSKTYPGTDVKLCGLDGKTLFAARVRDYPTTTHWDPSRHEVLFTPSQFKFDPKNPPPTLTIWNYQANTLTDIPFPR